MPLSPRVGGLSSKPADISPSPASQRFASSECQTTIITYEFFNELIQNFTLAQVAYGVTNVPNDPNSLKKILDNLRLNYYNFDTSDINIYKVGGGEILTITDSGATSATLANPVMAFRYQNGIGTSTTRLGYVGFGATSNKDLYVLNDDGNVVLQGDRNSVRSPFGGDILSIQDTGATSSTDANPIISFDYFVAGEPVRLGYVGFGATSNTDLYVLNDNGNLQLSGDNIILNGTCQVDTINEKTFGNGVLIDNGLIKDGSFQVVGSSNSFGSLGDLNFIVDKDGNNTNEINFYRHSRSSGNQLLGINENGDLSIFSRSGSDMLKLIDVASSSTLANPYISLGYNTSVGAGFNRIGVIGFTSTANNDIEIVNETSNGNIHIVAGGRTSIESAIGGDVLSVIDTGALNATDANPIISFDYLNSGVSTRLGYVGFGATSNKDLYVLNDDGNVVLQADGDVVLQGDRNSVRSFFGGDILSIQDTGATSSTDANPIISFDYFVAGEPVRLGYVGFGATSNKDLYVLNDDGNIRIQGDSIICTSEITAPSINFGDTSLSQCIDGTYTVQVVNGGNGNATIATRQIQAYSRIHKTVTISLVLDVQEMGGTDELDSYVTMPFNFAHMAQGTWIGFDRGVITSYAELQSVFTAGNNDATNYGVIVGVAGSNRAYFRNPTGSRTSFNNVENQWLIISITYQAT